MGNDLISAAGLIHIIEESRQSALKKVVGEHIHQAGSYVCDEYLRFDFNHFEKLTTKQLDEIEDFVN